MTWHRQHQHGRMVLQHPLVNLHQRTPGWCNSTAGVPTTPDESQCTFRHTSANSLSCPPAPNPPQGRSSRGSQWFVVDINITAWQLYSRAFDLSKRQVLLSSAHLSALQSDASVSQQQRTHLLSGSIVCNYCSVFSSDLQHKM